mgnify:FL=1
MDVRDIFFRLRTYTPIPIAITIIYYSSPVIPYSILGISLILIGELIRINAVRFAGGATRTRNVGAPFLCTSGPYSRTRNPLYWGNIIIYCGVAFLGGGDFMWELVTLVGLFFILQYYLIISLEEETLKLKFKDQYDLYTKNVPKLLPRIAPWNNDNEIKPQSMVETLKTEKRTLQNILFILFFIIFKSQIISQFNFL